MHRYYVKNLLIHCDVNYKTKSLDKILAFKLKFYLSMFGLFSDIYFIHNSEFYNN